MAVFGVRFLAAFLRVLRLWEPFSSVVVLLHSEPWSSCVSGLHSAAGVGSSEASVGGVEAGTAGATSEAAEEMRQGDPAW